MLSVAVSFRFAPSRPPTVGAEAMVATSQPLATRAGLRALEGGGSAVDAALAAAAVLCVAEPMSTGIGGDAFAIVWDGERLHGLDAAGPAPRGAEASAPVEQSGPRSVTVPGSVAGWSVLADRFGRLGLDGCLSDAIDLAERGVAVASVTAARWAEGGPAELGPPPRLGQIFRLPALGRTLRRIAEKGPSAFYEGEIAEAIVESSWLELEDLTSYRTRWVKPLSIDYRGTTVCELPPPGQGVAALEGLGLLELGEPTLLDQVECARLALGDALVNVRDGANVTGLLKPEYLSKRRQEHVSAAAEPPGGTVYLCAVDADGMAVSFIQSLFGSFGSKVVAPGTGIVLQNRGACFAVNGAVEPGRRPYHTIIPGMLMRDDRPLGPFGVMGGFIQAQAHIQLVSSLVDEGLDPQAALDRPRFRLEGGSVLLEEGLWSHSDELERIGLDVVHSTDQSKFGGGQCILVERDALLGGSDARKDGYAAGF
jgi:gamma-glutamyltranspeptidase/glutathione hydrolase